MVEYEVINNINVYPQDNMDKVIKNAIAPIDAFERFFPDLVKIEVEILSATNKYRLFRENGILEICSSSSRNIGFKEK